MCLDVRLGLLLWHPLAGLHCLSSYFANDWTMSDDDGFCAECCDARSSSSLGQHIVMCILPFLPNINHPFHFTRVNTIRLSTHQPYSPNHSIYIFHPPLDVSISVLLRLLCVWITNHQRFVLVLAWPTANGPPLS